MKSIQFLTLAAVAALLLIQTTPLRAEEPPKGDAVNTFTKWVTDWPHMEGVVGGEVGEGVYSGEVLSRIDGDVTLIEAIYRFDGSKHAFAAKLHIKMIGLHAVIVGEVIEGWLKGHAVVGEFTQSECDHAPLYLCWDGTLTIIKRRLKE